MRKADMKPSPQAGLFYGRRFRLDPTEQGQNMTAKASQTKPNCQRPPAPKAPPPAPILIRAIQDFELEAAELDQLDDLNDLNDE
jgi:hypothetical protein